MVFISLMWDLFGPVGLDLKNLFSSSYDNPSSYVWFVRSLPYTSFSWTSECVCVSLSPSNSKAILSSTTTSEHVYIHKWAALPETSSYKVTGQYVSVSGYTIREQERRPASTNSSGCVSTLTLCNIKWQTPVVMAKWNIMQSYSITVM